MALLQGWRRPHSLLRLVNSVHGLGYEITTVFLPGIDHVVKFGVEVNAGIGDQLITEI